MNERDRSSKTKARKSGTPARERTSRYGIRSINLALRLLERLAEDEAQLGTTELARQLGENKWRVFRHLHSLREEGYIEQDAATERFQIGAKFYQLASKLSRRFRVASVARPELVRLQETLGHSVVLAGLSDGAMIVLDGAAGNDSVKIVVAPGTRLDFPSSAVGKVALAFGPEELMQGVLKRPLRALTDRTITDRSTLQREVAAIRQRGWASQHEERHLGIHFAAAPIFSAGGKFEAAIGFVYFRSRREPSQEASKAEIGTLQAAAGRVSALLGHTPSSPQS